MQTREDKTRLERTLGPSIKDVQKYDQFLTPSPCVHKIRPFTGKINSSVRICQTHPLWCRRHLWKAPIVVEKRGGTRRYGIRIFTLLSSCLLFYCPVFFSLWPLWYNFIFTFHSCPFCPIIASHLSIKFSVRTCIPETHKHVSRTLCVEQPG